jgi:hypothetical protein
MTRKIRVVGPTLKAIRDVSSTLPRIDPAAVQAALGAEADTETLEEVLAPLTLFAVREELINRLQSRGGRPALAGTTRRAKIPLTDQEWLQLEELAAAVASSGFSPSAGQVASVLLSSALRCVASRNDGKDN